MSRKRKKRQKTKPAPRRTKPSDPAAAVLPTVWMLTVFITVVAEVTWGVGTVLAARSEDMRLAMMTAASMFAAAMVGLIALALTALVMRTMRPGPPKSLVALAVVVGLLPWAVLIVQLMN